MAALRITISTYSRVCVNGIDSTNSGSSEYFCPPSQSVTRSSPALYAESRFGRVKHAHQLAKINATETQIIQRIQEALLRIGNAQLSRIALRRAGNELHQPVGIGIGVRVAFKSRFLMN